MLTLWTYRGLQLLMAGLVVHLATGMYERFLTESKCPFCKADVPDTADLCPSCYRSLTGYAGIDIAGVLQTAFILLLALLVSFFILLPFPFAA